MKVYKYPFELNPIAAIDVHDVFRVLHVGLDGAGIPCIWALVDESTPKNLVKFHVIATGQEFDPGHCQFVGTLVDGPYRWHIFI